MRLVSIAMVGLMASTSAMAAATKHKATHAADAPAHVIPGDGVLGPADLIAIARLGARAAQDQYSDDPTAKYDGRQVVMTLSGDNIKVAFDKETHILSASMFDYSNDYDLAENVRESRYVGQNNFGVKAVVLRRRGASYGFETPDTQAFGEKNPTEFSVSLDGKSAKELSQAIRLRLTAMIAKADGVYALPGSVIVKKTGLHDATTDDPEDIDVDEYYVTVVLVQVEWIDSRTGTVLKTINLLSNKSK